MRLLYVDDDKFCQMVVRRLIAPLDFSLLVASSVEEAIDLLGYEKIDLLVTDFNMPGRSGLDLVRWVKGTASISSDIWTCLVSGTITEEFQQRSLGLGVDLVLEKPLTDSLIAALPDVVSGKSMTFAAEYD